MAITTASSSNGPGLIEKRAWIAPAFVLLLALVLRLFFLDVRSLWYDEAFAALFSQQGLEAMLYGTLSPVAGGAADIHPLLYYTTLYVWTGLFGHSVAILRLWSVLLGVVTVGLIYLLGRDLFDRRLGLVAALIAALAPFHVQYSQETRMYALVTLLLVAATLCFLRGWRSKSWGWWIAFGVLAGLAMYTQQLAAFFLLALALVPLLVRRWDQTLRVLVGGLVALVVYLPWLVNLPGQFEKVRAYYWLEAPSVARPLLTIRSFLSVNLDIPAPASVLAFVLALVLAVFLLIQAVFYLRRRSKPDQQPLLFVLWLAAGPPALMWLVSRWQPVYLERALLPSALMLYLALAWLFTRSGLPRLIAGLIAFAALPLIGIGLYYHYTWASFPNSPFDTAAESIRAQWQPGDVVIHQNKLTALPMIYYGPDLDQHYLADLPGSPQDTLALPTQQALRLLADNTAAEAAGAAVRIWWVAFDFAEAQYVAGNRPEYRDAIRWIEIDYELESVDSFNDLEVSLYVAEDSGA